MTASTILLFACNGIKNINREKGELNLGHVLGGEANMKILVTGGAGYLGSVLVPLLVSAGHEVEVMDIRQPISGNWTNRDIFSCPLSEADLRNVDAVIHLAALVGDIICHQEPQRTVEVNFLATKYLAHACKKADIRLIFASSCSVYGVKNELCQEGITEPEPYGVYGITKLAAESDVSNAGGISFRMATIYGLSPRMRYDLVINEFVRQAKTDKSINIFGGKQMRPFLEIKSAAKTYLECLKLEKSGGIFNLADENISLLALGQTVGEIFGCKVNVIPDIIDRRSYTIDYSRAMKSLSFKPKAIRDGIEEMESLDISAI